MISEQMNGGELREDAALHRAIDMFADVVLADPEVPEEDKAPLRILRELDSLQKRCKKISDYAKPDWDRRRREELYPLRTDVLEYLQLVIAGMDLFLQTHPMPERK